MHKYENAFLLKLHWFINKWDFFHDFSFFSKTENMVLPRYVHFNFYIKFPSIYGVKVLFALTFELGWRDLLYAKFGL